MARKKQKFYGVLENKELYLIEDALKTHAVKLNDNKSSIDLIVKLYSKFTELPQGHDLIVKKMIDLTNWKTEMCKKDEWCSRCNCQLPKGYRCATDPNGDRLCDNCLYIVGKEMKGGDKK